MSGAREIGDEPVRAVVEYVGFEVLTAVITKMAVF
jgi:hypothetical protein